MNARGLGLTIASIGLLAALPCSPPRNIREGLNDANTAADLAAKASRDAEAQARCNKLADEKVSYQEEYALGGTLAVNFAAANKPLVLAYDRTPTVAALKDPKAVKFDTASEDYKLALYVATVGKNLALQSGRPEIKWTFGILSGDQVNAFSAPGGYVLISKGAVKAAKNEDQLAGILAHEIGHIVKRHAISYYSAEKVSQCKLIAAANSEVGAAGANKLKNMFPVIYDAQAIGNSMERLASTSADVMNFDDPTNFDLIQMLAEKLAAKITEAGYSQDMEFEADQVAADLLLSAGYSTTEYGNLISTLGGSSTHPGGAERQKKLTEYVASKRGKDGDPFAGPESKRKPIAMAVTAK